MRLIDPTVQGPDTHHKRAPRLASVDGLSVGLLANGKVNADVLLRETAALFADRNGCQVAEMAWKRNASAPAEPATLVEVAATCDFMLTAMGD
jgi:hypothetical protein|tara:strand:- start:3471 stop:3749 length:279 start_codon:yes stop_codon:yes gene_type:complete